MNEELPEMHPDVRLVLETFTPGDFAELPLSLAAAGMHRFLRLQLHPYLPYAETDARWIIQAWRNKIASEQKAETKGGIRDWIKKRIAV